jgi:hypothetical protein
MKWSSRLFVTVLFSVSLSTPVRADVVTYNAPVAASGAPDFSVKADSKGVFVHHARVAGYAIFSCDGPVAMEVTWMGAMDSVVVRPLRLGIKPLIEGHKITFTLPKPTSLMHGFDAAHGIDGVTLSNFRIQGKSISNEEQLKLDKNEFVKGLVFE